MTCPYCGSADHSGCCDPLVAEFLQPVENRQPPRFDTEATRLVQRAVEKAGEPHRAFLEVPSLIRMRAFGVALVPASFEIIDWCDRREAKIRKAWGL